MSTRPMSPLRRRMIDGMTLQGYAESSIKSYVWAVQQFSVFHGRSPDRLSDEEIRSYLVHLTDEKKSARGTLSVTLAGIRYFYTHVVPRDLPTLEVARPKRSKRLPVTLTRQEVWRVFDEVRSDHYRACLVTVYSCGLRRQEAIQLRLGDVDGQRRLLHVHGKGGKDRFVPLPKKTLTMLRRHWTTHRSPEWLFPAVTRHGIEHSVATGAGHLNRDSLRRAFRQAVNRAGIRKRVCLHSLRHTYATHLIEDGVPLPMVQTLLGHAHIETTSVYTHVTREIREKAAAPIERLLERP